MKTAMMILYNELKEPGALSDRSKVLIRIRELLDKEKEQIIKAVNDCWDSQDRLGYVPGGETYYTKTYNQ